MTFRPTLRPEVGIAAAEGRQGDLCDALTARMIKAGAVTRAVVAAIDGARTVEEVLAHARGQVPGVAQEQVEGALRTLFLLTMVEGAGDTARSLVTKVTSSGAKLGPVFLPEARFACQGSGQCCKIYEYGPLEPEDRARLDALPIAATYPHLGPGPYFEEKKDDGGQKSWFLKRNGTRCIFLLPDTRCGIHAAFGGDKKPNLCRRFPFRTLLTVEGLKVFDQGECATYAVSARAGDTLAAQLSWLEPLLPKNPPFFHPVVALDDRTGCDYAFVLALEKRLCELITQAGTAGGALTGMSGLVHAFRDALVRCPLEPGEPEATLARLFGRDLASFEPPVGPAPREGFASIARFAQVLGERIEADPKSKSAITGQLLEALKVICLLAAHRFDPEAHPAPEWLPELLAVELLPKDTTEVLKLSMRNLTFGDHLLVADRLVPALVRFALIHLVTTIGARLRAWLQNAPRVRLEDLSFAHNIALVMTRKDVVRDVVLAFEDHADVLCRAAAELGAG